MNRPELHSREYLERELAKTKARFEVVLEAYRHAETTIEYERGDCFRWTREQALAELREDLEAIE